MQIGQIQSLLGAATSAAPAAPQRATEFQALADSLIALLSDDDSQTDPSNGLSSLLGEDDDQSSQSTDQLQSPPGLAERAAPAGPARHVGLAGPVAEADGWPVLPPW